MSVKQSIKVVDLFCGVGGLTHGLQKAGLNVVAGIDNDATCRYAYETNNNSRFIEDDIAELGSHKIEALFEGATIKILVGCAPCQRFSKQAKKYLQTFNHETDKRWNLLRSFEKYISEIRPTIVSMENVPELCKYDIFKDFYHTLINLGYKVNYKIVDCSKYGLPQRRRRLVLLASTLGDIKLLAESDFKSKRTVRDAIGSLPKIEAGETDKKDPLHKCAGLSEINKERIKQSKPGGTWRDWDETLLPNCYKKKTGISYTSVYGRMEWDKPSPTITTQFFIYGTGRYGHPEQNRALSLREGAMLQTFPIDYKFFENPGIISIGTIARHIGNAVPVDLGTIIGKSIIKHLGEHNKYGSEPT